MYQVIETPLFEREWPMYWTESEHTEFKSYVAYNPLSGDIVPGTGGIRKIRWRRQGMGKSGGVRVIYFVRTSQGKIYLLKIYSKSRTSNLTNAVLRKIRDALEE